MKLLLPLAVACTAVGLQAQIVVNEIAAPINPANEIDFDSLPPGPTTVAAINAAATPGAANLTDIVLTASTAAAGVYDTNSGVGNALAFLNGGLEVIAPTGGFDAFNAQILFAGPSNEFGMGIGDWNGPMVLEFFNAGTSLGTYTTTAYSATSTFKYFETPNDTFDEVTIMASTTGGNWVITGLSVEDVSGVPTPALRAQGFVNGVANVGAAPAPFTDGDVLSWGVNDIRDLIAGAPAVFFLNVGQGEPPVGDSTPLLPPQFIQLTPLSNPQGLGLNYPGVVTGGSAGGGSMNTQPIPPGILGNGIVIRLQPLVVDLSIPGPALPFRTSNPVRFAFEGPAIVVSAEGTNSFNADPTSGFFQVRHGDPSRADIVSVTFDGTTNGQNFDTDQTGMADVFEGGNSVMAGCAGTYRNGSDVSTGLVYDAANTVPATPCDAAANTGWIGTNQTATVGTFETMQFRFGTFTPGLTFEVDMDTDAATITGGAMAGMTITVELSDGTVLSGVLVADPANPNRSEVRL